jgi:hypothetical protein
MRRCWKGCEVDSTKRRIELDCGSGLSRVDTQGRSDIEAAVAANRTMQQMPKRTWQ